MLVIQNNIFGIQVCANIQSHTTWLHLCDYEYFCMLGIDTPMGMFHM